MQQLQEVRELLDEHRDRVLALLRAVEELVDVQLLDQLRLLRPQRPLRFICEKKVRVLS